VRALLDPSVLIGAEDAGDLECAISAASLAELHFGVLVAADEDERARRVAAPRRDQQQRVLERRVRAGVRHPCHPTWMWSRWSARANPRGSLGPSGSQQ
jgi:hypothetical protein